MHTAKRTRLFGWLLILSFLFTPPARVVGQTSESGARKLSAIDLIALSKSGNSKLGPAIISTLDPKQLAAGTAWLENGPDFFFALQAASRPELFIDDAPVPGVENLAGSDLWYATARVEPVGKLHSFYYRVGGARFGGSRDLPALGPDAYPQPGAPSGTLSAKISHTSKIYEGMKSEYRVYVPAAYHADTPAALMVFQDGGAYIEHYDHAVLHVIDNLIAQKKIPPLIAVFINPGDIGDSSGTATFNFVKAYSEKWQRTLKDSMRSTLYDTVSDRYARYLRDEVLAEIAAKYKIRKDAYSRAIAGASSGGICAFNAAWQMPDQFSRVISWIGSFSGIQWREDPTLADGGQDYPDKVLRENKRNLRVWLQDGSEDLQNRYGDWPLANLRMANALKFRGYDFHFSLGGGTHNPAHGTSEFPEEMIWLWRDYDSQKTEQVYEMDLAERSKPAFRVSLRNREDK